MQGTSESHSRITALLCPELQSIVTAELAAGNIIHQAWDDWGIGVLFARPFTKSYPDTASTEYREVNDPHWWLAEYTHRDRHEIVACNVA